jgi:superfamily II DNA/RNA helicase
MTLCIEMICLLCKSLSIRFESLSGQNARARREDAISKFVSDPNIKVFVSTDAGGVGVNLQIARIVINFDPAWNPSTNAQRIQRVHRIGQKRNVTAIYLLTPLDEMFVTCTYLRKLFSTNQIDEATKSKNKSALPTWAELGGVIQTFQSLANAVRL